MNLKENTSVVQANYLIENRPWLTKDETRLFLTIIATIRKDEEDFKPLQIPVKEFASLWGVDPKNAYMQIRDALRGLRGKEFYIEGVNPDTGRKRFISSSSISTAMYEEGEGYATVEISKLFKPYLLQLQTQYTSYVLQNIMDLTTVNAIRSYEILKQYQSLGERTLTYQEYKQMLKIEDKYPDNTDFRRYVIEPSIEEINEKTDIRVTCEYGGRGKKAYAKFTIVEKPPQTPPIEVELEDPDQLNVADVEEQLRQNRANAQEQEAVDFFRALLPNEGKEFSDADIAEQKNAALRSLYAKHIKMTEYPESNSLLLDAMKDYILTQYYYSRRRSTMQNGFHGYFVQSLLKDNASYWRPDDDERQGSFDTDEFYEAAVKRSMGD